MTDSPEISVIVPFFNEEQNIGRMHEAIVTALEPLGVAFEVVMVNDGSRDRTLELAIDIARKDARVCVVNFRRNFGQTPAMAAGIQQATGRVLVTMDGDLQNDPLDVARLLETINAGYDIVVGWRFNRQDKLISRKVPSVIANWLIGKVTGVPIRDNGCSLKAYRADLIKEVPLYSEMHRFIPAVASIAGPRIAEIKVRHHARKFGQSKYGLSRIYKVLLDLMVIKTVTTFSSRPMQWFALLALPLLILGFSTLAGALWNWGLTGQSLSLPLAGTGAILLMGAVILLGAGVVGELLYKLGDLRDRDFSRLTLRVRRPLRGRPNTVATHHG